MKMQFGVSQLIQKPLIPGMMFYPWTDHGFSLITGTSPSHSHTHTSPSHTQTSLGEHPYSLTLNWLIYLLLWTRLTLLWNLKLWPPPWNPPESKPCRLYLSLETAFGTSYLDPTVSPLCLGTILCNLCLWPPWHPPYNQPWETQQLPPWKQTYPPSLGTLHSALGNLIPIPQPLKQPL